MSQDTLIEYLLTHDGVCARCKNYFDNVFPECIMDNGGLQCEDCFLLKSDQLNECWDCEECGADVFILDIRSIAYFGEVRCTDCDNE